MVHIDVDLEDYYRIKDEQRKDPSMTPTDQMKQIYKAFGRIQSVVRGTEKKTVGICQYASEHEGTEQPGGYRMNGFDMDEKLVQL